ncbi:MAG: hypothetical protein KJZ70_14230 [Bryobacterales bacterium]|nr:hypothetical protein [Bryobacterales bacterium]
MDATLLNEAAIRLRDSCLADPSNPDLECLRRILESARAEDRALAVAAARLLIRTVVEELSDRFNPELSACYVEIFSRVIASVIPAFSDRFLRERYADLCAAPARPLAGDAPESVIILSRITLGADIAITSVFLRALRLRFPKTTLWFAGSAKNFELFAGMPGVRHWPVSYPRAGTLAERFAVVRDLDGALGQDEYWLMDPDSRITQLGLLPAAPLRATLFFESRSAAPESNKSLSALASGWCAEYLDVPDARPEIALSPEKGRGTDANAGRGGICVSLGVGNNDTKRLSASFEVQLLRILAATGRRIWIDSGAGEEEAEAVRAAVAASGTAAGRIEVLRGSFVDFCRVIRRASLYVGYDSAGQHAAAAMGVPAITLFKGYPNERMFCRWQPRGFARSKVIRIPPGTAEGQVLEHLRSAVHEVL